MIFEKAEICIPANQDSTIFITGNVILESLKYDITGLLKTIPDFLDSS